MATTDEIRKLATAALLPRDVKILAADIDEICRRADSLSGSLIEVLIKLIEDFRKFRDMLVYEYRTMEADLRDAASDKNKIHRMLKFLAIITPQSKLNGDKKAFSRWMDVNAVRDRARARLHHSERLADSALKMLGAALAEKIRTIQRGSIADYLQDLNMFELFWTELDDSPRWQNRLTVLSIWIKILQFVAVDDRQSFFPEKWKNRLNELANGADDSPWIQLTSIDIQSLIDATSAFNLILQRFESPRSSKKDFFLRAGIVRTRVTGLNDADFKRLFDIMIEKPESSQHVWISLAKQMQSMPLERIFEYLPQMLAMPALNQKVSATLIVSMAKITPLQFSKPENKEMLERLINILVSAKISELLPTRAMLMFLREAAIQYSIIAPSREIRAIENEMLHFIDRLIVSIKTPDLIRREASEVREEILLKRDSALRNKIIELEALIKELPETGTLEIPIGEFSDEEIFGRVLALISRKDLGVSALVQHDRYRIIRGDVYTRKLWRIWHELINPGPSKRQGFLHSVGREAIGTIRAPSRVLCEMTQTKVPGEHVLIPSEATWRPYVPTVDDFLSLCRADLAGKAVKIFSAEGITEIQGPNFFFDRKMLLIRLSSDYNELSSKRNVESHQIEKMAVRTFVQILMEDFGLKIAFRPHSYIFQNHEHAVIDPVVSQNLYPAANRVLKGSMLG